MPYESSPQLKPPKKSTPTFSPPPTSPQPSPHPRSNVTGGLLLKDILDVSDDIAHLLIIKVSIASHCRPNNES